MLSKLYIGFKSFFLIVEHLAHHPRQLHQQSVSLLLLLLLLAHDLRASCATEWTCLVHFGPLVDAVVAERMQARLYRDLNLLVETDLAQVAVLLFLFGLRWRHFLFLLTFTRRILFFILCYRFDLCCRRLFFFFSCLGFGLLLLMKGLPCISGQFCLPLLFELAILKL